jgi:hypothetical protein
MLRNRKIVCFHSFCNIPGYPLNLQFAASGQHDSVELTSTQPCRDPPPSEPMIKEQLDVQYVKRNYENITSPRKRLLETVFVIVGLSCAGLYGYSTRQFGVAALIALTVASCTSTPKSKKRIAELELQLAEERLKNANLPAG